MAIKLAVFLQLALVAATSPECQSNNAECIADPSEEPSADELNVQLLQNKLEHKYVSSDSTVKGIKEDEAQLSLAKETRDDQAEQTSKLISSESSVKAAAAMEGNEQKDTYNWHNWNQVEVGAKAILIRNCVRNCHSLGLWLNDASSCHSLAQGISEIVSNVQGYPLGIEQGVKSGDEQEQSSGWKSLSCQEAAHDLGFDFDWRDDIETIYRPPGCYQASDDIFYFNNKLTGNKNFQDSHFEGNPVCQLPSCQMLNERNTGFLVMSTGQVPFNHYARNHNPDGVCGASSCSNSGSQCPVSFDHDASDMPVQATFVASPSKRILKFEYCHCCKESCPTTTTTTTSLTCPQMLEQLQTEKEQLQTENEILRQGICPSSP